MPAVVASRVEGSGTSIPEVPIIFNLVKGKPNSLFTVDGGLCNASLWSGPKSHRGLLPTAPDSCCRVSRWTCHPTKFSGRFNDTTRHFPFLWTFEWRLRRLHHFNHLTSRSPNENRYFCEAEERDFDCSLKNLTDTPSNRQTSQQDAYPQIHPIPAHHHPTPYLCSMPLGRLLPNLLFRLREIRKTTNRPAIGLFRNPGPVPDQHLYQCRFWHSEQ